MPRDAVTITSLALDAGVLEDAGTAISVANGSTIPAGGDTRGLLVVVKNTEGTTNVVTFAAGTGPTSSLGDVTATIAATTGVQFFNLESARVCQADGAIHADYEVGMTGTIHAYRLPDGAL
jgi:hypothetical protein